MQLGSEKENHFQKLIDNIRTAAQARGADDPGWNDVWTALTQTPAYASALNGRGIDTSTMSMERQYIEAFKPDLIASYDAPDDTLVRAIVEELREEFGAYLDTRATMSQLEEADKDKILNSLRTLILKNLTKFPLPETEDEIRRAQLKDDILTRAANAAVSNVVGDIGVGLPIPGGIKTGMLQGITQKILHLSTPPRLSPGRTMTS